VTAHLCAQLDAQNRSLVNVNGHHPRNADLMISFMAQQFDLGTPDQNREDGAVLQKSITPAFDRARAIQAVTVTATAIAGWLRVSGTAPKWSLGQRSSPSPKVRGVTRGQRPASMTTVRWAPAANNNPITSAFRTGRRQIEQGLLCLCRRHPAIGDTTSSPAGEMTVFEDDGRES